MTEKELRLEISRNGVPKLFVNNNELVRTHANKDEVWVGLNLEDAEWLAETFGAKVIDNRVTKEEDD